MEFSTDICYMLDLFMWNTKAFCTTETKAIVIKRCPSLTFTFCFLLGNNWTKFDETLPEASTQCLLLRLCFSGRSENQKAVMAFWLAEILSTSLQLLNRIKRNLTWSKYSTSSPRLTCLLRVDWKTKMAALASDWLIRVRFLSCNRWTEFNKTL